MKRYRSMFLGVLLFLALAMLGTGHAAKTEGHPSALPCQDGSDLAQMTEPEPSDTPPPSKKKQGAQGTDDDDEVDDDSDEVDDDDKNEDDDES